MLTKEETISLMISVIRYVKDQKTFEALAALKKLKRSGDEQTIRDVTKIDPYIRHLINIA